MFTISPKNYLPLLQQFADLLKKIGLVGTLFGLYTTSLNNVVEALRAPEPKTLSNGSQPSFDIMVLVLSGYYANQLLHHK